METMFVSKGVKRFVELEHDDWVGGMAFGRGFHTIHSRYMETDLQPSSETMQAVAKMTKVARRQQRQGSTLETLE